MKSWIAALVIVLVGCSHIGNEFDIKKADEFKPGITTLAEATEALGKPSSVRLDREGKKLVQWAFIKSSMIGASSARFGGVFDQKDVFVRAAVRNEN